MRGPAVGRAVLWVRGIGAAGEKGGYASREGLRAPPDLRFYDGWAVTVPALLAGGGGGLTAGAWSLR